MAWIHYEYTSSFPKFYYDINYTTSRSGGQVTVNFTIDATINGYANILGPVVFQVGYWNGSTDTQVTIKERSGDNWSGGTRTRTCSLTFTDYGTSRGFYVRVNSGDLSNAYMPQNYGVCNFAGMVAPSAPAWMSTSPTSVEVNSQFLVSWATGTPGSLPITGYDVWIKAFNGSVWTDWAAWRTNINYSSFWEVAPKNINVYGVTGAPNVKFVYIVRARDGVNVSPWTQSNEVNISFISPTSPSQVLFDPSKAIKKTQTVTINWTKGVGGSGSITSYGLSFRRFNKDTGIWSNWTTNININALKYVWSPFVTYPTLDNGDMLQSRVSTKNNWGISSSYVVSTYLNVKGNIIRIGVNTNWYEGMVYVGKNTNWYEGTAYVGKNGNWYESI